MAYGKKVWVFPDAELPPKGVNLIPGHESIIITNTGKTTAKIKVTLFFTEKEPVSFFSEVEAERVRCLRTNQKKDFGDFIPEIGEQYAIMLESDVPVVAQYGRAEPREVNFYTTPGYCE
ncbi:MAG: sensory rhodopsin transducer [Candidatus Cloacimonetes bacterium]|nr:sensory rhodopsin transducer [Candidatus Cloacimonadota bacterium]